MDRRLLLRFGASVPAGWLLSNRRKPRPQPHVYSDIYSNTY